MLRTQKGASISAPRSKKSTQIQVRIEASSSELVVNMVNWVPLPFRWEENWRNIFGIQIRSWECG